MRTAGGLALLCLLTIAGTAGAEQYQGWGDTGWVYASRRECCNAAIEIATAYSEQACMNTGGRPNGFRGGGQRGSCQVEWTQDEYNQTLFRCSGEAAVWCSSR